MSIPICIWLLYGVWSYFSIGRRHGRHRPWLRCCHVGLPNPNMVTSCHIREYMKSKKRRKMVKALRSKWEVVRVDTYILKCLLYLVIVMLILIVGYIDNMLLVTDVYYLLSLLMARLWWPWYDTLVYYITLSSGDIIDRQYRWWSFFALHTGKNEWESWSAH